MNTYWGLPVLERDHLPADAVIFTKDKTTLIYVVELEQRIEKLQKTLGLMLHGHDEWGCGYCPQARKVLEGK